ncbi:unnamed protein product [Dicrocoelium dendriticum]|nr:unnamed protein product [Dicrocoelium dendriticum]
MTENPNYLCTQYGELQRRRPDYFFHVPQSPQSDGHTGHERSSRSQDGATAFQFRPRRLLQSISHVLVPRKFAFDPMMIDRGHKRYKERSKSMWLTDFDQSQSVDSNTTSSFIEKKRISQPVVARHGRFVVGHPESCNASIVDDLDQAPADNAPLGNGVENICVSNSSIPAHNGGLLTTEKAPTRFNTFRPNAVIMENDLLRTPSLLPPNKTVLVRMNISGSSFLVSLSTLQRDHFVYSKLLEDALWLPEQKEYFLERDPGVFRFVHNYLRRGEVHLPAGVCGPLLEKELDDWGIPLGLDIQRCCLGPVMDSKSKLQSLKKFERKLEPKYIKPRAWIKSAKWQSFRAKVWHILEVAPRLGNHEPGIHFDSSDTITTVNGQFFGDEKAEIGDKRLETPAEPGVEGAGDTNSPLPFGSMLKETATEPHSFKEPQYVEWLKRIYAVFETSIVTAAVIVFMLSSCAAFRVPIDQEDPTYRDVGNQSLSLFHVSGNWRNNHGAINGSNNTQFTLPIRTLVSMDIFFSIVITLDVLMRMVFCPAIRSWLFSMTTLIDILSLIPFYCELIIYEMIYYKVFFDAGEWLSILMEVENYVVVLKVFIVLRLFRVLRRHRGTHVLLYTIRTTFLDLAIIIILILESALFFGAAIYFTDENFQDIPTGFWWAVITMTTVGYGDLVPSHTFGYMVAMVCVLTGTLLMSYTIPILVNHFLLYYEHADQLHMMKQVHRSAKRKARKWTMAKYAQRAFTSARVLVNATLTRSMAKSNHTNPDRSCMIAGKAEKEDLKEKRPEEQKQSGAKNAENLDT